MLLLPMTIVSSVDNLFDQLIRDENEVLHAYQDSEGWWTIGIGRLIDSRKGGGITDAEARYLLGNDIARVTRELQGAFPWVASLSRTRFAVLQAMCFNMGLKHLSEFQKMLSALALGNYADAAREMLDSAWAKQVGPRADRLAKQMATDTWQ
jgi:lysozyme